MSKKNRVELEWDPLLNTPVDGPIDTCFIPMNPWQTWGTVAVQKSSHPMDWELKIPIFCPIIRVKSRKTPEYFTYSYGKWSVYGRFTRIYL